MQSNNFSPEYKMLLAELHRNGGHEINSRTREPICYIRGGWSFKVDLDSGRIPVPGNRRYFTRVAAAEVAWQFMGTQSPDFILAKAPKIWSDFVEDGKLKTAYGYRWRKHFKRDQLMLAIAELRENPTNRQLYISAWDPSTDGLGTPGQPKNIPCPIGFHVFRECDTIHMSMMLRSSDVFVGLPYDVMGYALTLDAIAAEVGCKPGTLHVTLAHPHYYGVHATKVDKCLNGGGKNTWLAPDQVEPPLPGWSVTDIIDNPDMYVDLVGRMSKRQVIHPYSPLPELVL